MSKIVIMAPEGAQLPENAHNVEVLQENVLDDIVAQIKAIQADPESAETVPFIRLSTRALQCLVDYPDQFPLDLVHLDNALGAAYTSPWYSLADYFPSVTPDTLNVMLEKVRKEDLSAVDAHERMIEDTRVAFEATRRRQQEESKDASLTDVSDSFDPREEETDE